MSDSTPIQLWEAHVRRLRTGAEALLDGMATPIRYWERAGLQPLVDGTAPGAIVPGGTMTGAEAQMLGMLSQHLLQFLYTPIPAYKGEDGSPVYMAPVDILTWRPGGPAPGPEPATPDAPLPPPDA